MREALSNPSYVLLTIGFFVCGFHIAFITVHFPGYLADLGFDANIAAWAIAVIGICNMLGSYCSGLLSNKWPKRDMLCSIYFLRGVVITLFMITPITLTSVFLFSAALGLLWLATVPPTSGLVAVMFGTRYMALLYGLVFLSHQLGGFAGVFLGGYLYEQSEQFQIIVSFCGQYLGFNAYGDAARYNVIWLISIALALLATLAHWPIREQAAGRFASR